MTVVRSVLARAARLLQASSEVVALGRVAGRTRRLDGSTGAADVAWNFGQLARPCGLRFFSSTSSSSSSSSMRGKSDDGSESDDGKDEHNQASLAMQDPMARLMASRGMPLGFGVPEPGQVKDTGYEKLEAIDEIFDAAKTAAAAEHQRQMTDVWGTTREGPAEIARRIVDTNEGGGRPVPLASQVAEDLASTEASSASPEELLTLSQDQSKYKSLEDMSKDIKGLDEVFEVLASVPWLDEADLQQKELKGVAMVGLLGTLEEVGFNIRPQVERIWAGDHDDGMVLECSEAKDQAAVISILFHTQKLVEQYGRPVPVKAGAVVA